MRHRAAIVGTLAAACALFFVLAGTEKSADRYEIPGVGAPRTVAPGVLLYHATNQALIDPPGAVSLWILRLDSRLVDLEPALAHDQVMHTEPVAAIAERHGALAAINAGFFLPNGDPHGIYQLGGRLVSDTKRPRGAVGIVRRGPTTRLMFGRVSARVTLRVGHDATNVERMDIAGVNTTRQLGKLMLFTPAYHVHTDTAAGGSEWMVADDPPRVVDGPRTEGKTPIPPGGFVLSFGGRRPPPLLASLEPGTFVDLDTEYESAEPDVNWAEADEIIGGAGLLVRDGSVEDDWSVEAFAAGFAENRHPRTMIGTGADGSIWLLAVDGRQPQLAAGMTLVELRELARKLELTNALNLDGGGSTTMWVNGEIVNSPSDASGQRPVSDALLVFVRGTSSPGAP